MHRCSVSSTINSSAAAASSMVGLTFAFCVAILVLSAYLGRVSYNRDQVYNTGLNGEYVRFDSR